MFLAKRPTPTSRKSQAGDRHFKSNETRDNLVRWETRTRMNRPVPGAKPRGAIRCSYMFRSSIDGFRSFAERLETALSTCTPRCVREVLLMEQA